MIFLEKNHHAVGKLDALGLLRLERRQGWDGDLLPGGRLLGRGLRSCSQGESAD
jgi:hypothetical protein